MNFRNLRNNPLLLGWEKGAALSDGMVPQLSGFLLRSNQVKSDCPENVSACHVVACVSSSRG